MIYHASMRTDIPAFYSTWFINRIKAGFFCVRNPYNPEKIIRYDLSPNVTDIMMFCSKNPAPLLPYLSALKDYHQSWNVTITGYDSDIEQNVPFYKDVINATKYLSNKITPQNISWRYDPILITDKYNIDFHINTFTRIAESLKNYVSCVIISFIEVYPKLTVTFSEAKSVSVGDKCTILTSFAQIADKLGLTLKLCGDKTGIPSNVLDLVNTDGCETRQTLQNIAGYPLQLPTFKPKRPQCTCYLGIDMGAYNSCPHFCKYCYANTNQDTIIRNKQTHNPESPILLEDILPSENVSNALCKSYKSLQMSLF